MIGSRSGLHLRPAGQLCKKAMEYQCRVQMVLGDRSYNMKSVLSVLSAQVTDCCEIELICDGADEKEAHKALSRYLEEGME